MKRSIPIPSKEFLAGFTADASISSRDDSVPKWNTTLIEEVQMITAGADNQLCSSRLPVQ